jgi:hypothetical protein
MRRRLHCTSALCVLTFSIASQAQRSAASTVQCQTREVLPLRTDVSTSYYLWNLTGTSAIEILPAPSGVELIRYTIDTQWSAPTITASRVELPESRDRSAPSHALPLPSLSADGRSVVLVSNSALGPSGRSGVIISLDALGRVLAQLQASTFNVGGFVTARHFADTSKVLIVGAEGFVRADLATLATEESVAFREAIPNAHGIASALPMTRGRVALCGEVGEPRRARTIVWDFARRSTVFGVFTDVCRLGVSREGSYLVLEYPEHQFTIYNDALRAISRVRADEVVISGNTVITRVHTGGETRTEFSTLRGALIRRVAITHTRPGRA